MERIVNVFCVLPSTLCWGEKEAVSGKKFIFPLLIFGRKPTLDHRISSCYPNSELFLKG